MPEGVTNLPQLANGVFESILSFRQRLRKGFDVPLPELRRDMQVIFDEMDIAAQHDARLSRVYQDQGKYILAGFVDDVVTNSEWRYAYDWKNHLLEDQYFGSAIAGERIPEIIQEVTGSTEEVGLAELLFVILALGFRGRFEEGTGELEALRTRLYRLMPNRLAEGESRIVPDAYGHTEVSSARRLRPLFTFLQVCLVSVMAVIVVLAVFFLMQGSRSSKFENQVIKPIVEAAD